MKALRMALDLLALFVSLPFFFVGALAGAVYGGLEYGFTAWVRYWRSGEVLVVLLIPTCLLGWRAVPYFLG